MRVRNLLVLAMATLLLAGCGAVNAGSAATVAGTEISESALAAAMNELTAEVSASQLGASDAELATTVLNRLVILEVVRKLGEEAEVFVSDSEIAAERSRVKADFGTEAELIEAGLQQAIPPSLINSVFEISLYVSKIGTKLQPSGSETDKSAAFESFLFAWVDTANVEVSPRYGEWDKTQATVGPTTNPLVFSPQE